MSGSAGSASSLRIVALFPELLGTYGDSGNVTILAQRARWRGQQVDLVTVDAQTPVPVSGDIYVLGGGEDGAQAAAVGALRATANARSPLAEAVDGGAQVLAVCAGLQMVGESFLDAAGNQVAGLGLVDLRTSRLGTRAVGDVVAEPDPDLHLPTLSGFENHGGSTTLGEGVRPLARVREGVGNGPPARGEVRAEGVLTDALIGTYLHGPVLARNPMLADLLTSRAMGCSVAELGPLDITEHAALRRRMRIEA